MAMETVKEDDGQRVGDKTLNPMIGNSETDQNGQQKNQLLTLALNLIPSVNTSVLLLWLVAV